MNKKINKLSIVSFVLTVLGLLTFFEKPIKYTSIDRLILWVFPGTFYLITLPLIVISLIINGIAIYQIRENRHNPVFSILAIIFYLLFLIFILTFAKIEFNIAVPPL